MPILLHNINFSLEQTKETAFEKARERLLGTGCEIKDMQLRKLSVDARRRNNIRFVCSVQVELENPEVEKRLTEGGATGEMRLVDTTPIKITKGTQRLNSRPVVVGFGPAGMFAALLLAKEGYRPIVLERGGNMQSRTRAVESFWSGGTLDPQTNVQFGEGGAGTFSDGKLTTRIGDPLCDYVLNEMISLGAPKDIMGRAKPHIGTDNLRHVVTALRERVIALGGEVRFETKLTDISINNGRLCGYTDQNSDHSAEVMVLAPGHSARDTFRLLARQGANMQSKPFSVGLRIEHSQKAIDKGLYGQHAGHKALPVGEYQLSLRQNGRAVYTFCMCPGGVVVPAASEQDGVVVNGMSYYARNGKNANSAVVVSVDSADFGSGIFAGVEFQEKLERAAAQAGGGRFTAPAQDVGSFCEARAGLQLGQVEPSYPLGVTACDFRRILPSFVTDMIAGGLQKFDRQLPGFAAKDAIFTGVESRTSSPLRILRGQDGQADGIEGLYPSGEGAGYAGGIMSAAVDGLRSALCIMEKFAPPD